MNAHIIAKRWALIRNAAAISEMRRGKIQAVDPLEDASNERPKQAKNFFEKFPPAPFMRHQAGFPGGS